MKKIRIALIGCGRRAPAWLRSLQLVEGLELVAICDRIEPRVRERMTLVKNKPVAGFTDHRKMIRELDFDAVAIVTEPEYQAPLSVEFMNAGKHVISEVPVTYSLDECWDLILTVERTGRLYYLAEQIRHSPMALQWRDLVRAGTLGKILFAEGHYLHAMADERFWIDPTSGKRLTWQEAAGNPNAVKSRFWSLKNPILYAPHELSPLLKILDDRVVRVSCFSTRRESYRFEEVPFEGQNQPVSLPDLQVALMHTAGDTIIRFAGGFNAPVSENHWYHLLGTKGEIETGRGLGETGHRYVMDKPVLKNSDYLLPRTPAEWKFAEDSPQQRIAAQTGHGGLDYWPIYDFAQVLLGRKPSPDIDVYQAVETAAPVILAVESQKQGGALQQVPVFRPGPNRKAGEDPRTRPITP
jgi:predicted dehydrogenase